MVSGFPNMAEVARDRLARFADRTFLILPDGERRTSYAEFGELMRAAAGLLAESGLSAGDHAVMAAAAALGAHGAARGRAVWRHAAEPPLHPFDLVC